MIKVRALSSITHQPTFQSSDIRQDLQILSNDSEVIAPDYKTYIPPAALRRLSPVLRMAIAAASDCQQQIEESFDAISVGTALGCLKDTERFLQTYLTATGDTLSPTAFIQSTHNTIGGQISLALNNHAYNMTHTQNSLSFEVALIDALLCVRDGKKQVLVGAADEAIEFLELLRPELIRSELPFTSGASFFVLGTDGDVEVVDCYADFQGIQPTEVIHQFLQRNGLQEDAISILLSCNAMDWEHSEQFAYAAYSGLYYSNSAFGFHLAHDYLKNDNHTYALVVNNQVDGKLGLILLRKSE